MCSRKTAAAIILGWLTQLESAVDGWLETLQEGEAEGQPCMFGIALSECLSCVVVAVGWNVWE